jgi:hypothetical protein
MEVNVLNNFEKEKNKDCFALRELLIYGLRGVCAYFFHAEKLYNNVPEKSKGYTNEVRDAIYKDLIHLYRLTSEPDLPLGKLLELNLKLGEVNFRVM